MLPADGGSAFTNYDPQIVDLFGQLRDACQRCEDADEAQAQQMLSWVERFQNWCYGRAVDQYHREGRQYVTQMWERFDELYSAYATNVQPHAEVGIDLHAVYAGTWQPVAQALSPIVADVEARRQQTHWKGRSAGEYMGQLPVQASALQEFGTFLRVGGAGVETPALIQQGIFVTVVAFLEGTRNQVRAYAGAEVGTSSFFQRSRAAAEYLTGRVAAFRSDIVDGKVWRPALDSHIAQMTAPGVASPSVLTTDTWPTATTRGTV